MRKVLLGMIAILLLTFMTACGNQEATKPVIEKSDENTQAEASEQESSNAEEKENTKEVAHIRLGWANSGFPSPFTFSPNGPGGYLRTTFIFDTLTWKDDQGMKPWLSEKWQISEDDRTYTFTLRNNVKWHDGEDLHADDVKFTFEYFKQHPFGWHGDISMIEAVEVVNESTVKFVLNKPYAPFLQEVVGIIPIIPEHIWSKVEDPYQYQEKEALIGTGPYTLTSYEAEKGNYLFTANSEYFKGKPIVNEISYINVKDRALSLQNGEIDAAMSLNYQQMLQLKEKGFDVIQSKPTGSAVRFVFNLQDDQLKQKELRQAIAYALDRKTIAEKVLGGNEMVGSAGIIPPDSDWYNKDVKQYEYNVEKANKMLDDLGYTKNEDGMRKDLVLNLLVSSNAKNAQLAQAMLKNVGIELNIQQVDTATFTSLMGENNYDIALTGHIGLSGDPDFLRIWFMGQASNAYAARGKVFENERFIQLAEEQVMTLNEEKRHDLVNEMQDILAEELPTLLLYHRPFYWLYNDEQFAGWFNTDGGISDGIPLWENKSAFLNEE